MSLEEQISALIAALEQNTTAILSSSPNTFPSSSGKTIDKPEQPETAKQKKARLAKEKKAAIAADKKSGGNRITVDVVKALAKKIALACDDPKACMIQIREVVGIVAEACYDSADKGIDQFDEDGLTLLKEALNDFEYAAPEAEKEEAADDLEI